MAVTRSMARPFLAATLAVASAVLTGCAPCVGFCDAAFYDAGEKVGSLGTYLAVQRADELSGGNSVLGQSGPTGRSGKITLAVRVNRVGRDLPEVTGMTIRTDGSRPTSDFPTTPGSGVAISADIAVPIWRGIEAGESRVGGLDLLGNVAVLQDYPDNSLHLVTSGRVGGGAGVRIGLLEETRHLPGISLTGSLRGLPSLAFRTAPIATSDGGTMTLAANEIKLSMGSWRLAASKQFGRVGITAGAGGDRYHGSASYAVDYSPGTAPAPAGPGSEHDAEEFTVHRGNLFAGASYSVGRAAIVGEYGHLSDREPSQSSPSTVGGQSVLRSRNYLTLGVRLGSIF